MMRVLFVVASLDASYGGPVTATLGLAGALARRGLQVTVVGTGMEDHSEVTDGLAVFVAQRWPRLPAFVSSRFWAIARDAVKEAHLIHVIGLWHYPGTVTARLARAGKRPYVICPSGMLDRKALQRSRLKKVVFGVLAERRNLSHAAAMHLLNEHEVEQAHAFGVAVPVFVLPNGVEPKEFDAVPLDPELAGWASGLQGQAFVLFLGRIHPKKGLDVLVPAFAKVHRARPNVRLVVAGPGDGVYEPRVRAWVRAHGIEAAVTFTGPVTGLVKRALLAAATVFVLPSHHEGDPVAVKEAMAAALPVVISSGCHLEEVTRAGAGIVVPPESGAVAQALESILRDPGRREMGARGRQLVEQRYTWDRLSGEMVGVYEDIIAGTRRGQAWR